MNWLKLLAIVSLGVLIIPVLVLLYEGFGPYRSAMGYSYAVFRSIELTLLSSALAALACVVLFTPLAFYLARNESKLGETLADIPATIPHPIIGIAILVLFSPLNPFGSFMQSIGINLFDSLLGLVVALISVSAPIYIKAMQPYFQSMNRSTENFAMGLGASKFRTFVSVVLPNSTRGIIGAGLISMSRAMSEFGSIAIVAYYVLYPKAFFGVSPASIFIYNLFTYSGLEGTLTASAVMIVVSVSIMMALRFAGVGKMPRPQSILQSGS